LPLVSFLNEAIGGRDEKEFARHRNNVHYVSNHWIADDLLQANVQGPIKQATSSQEVYEEIVQGSAAGAVYLMCGLVELICQIAQPLATSKVLEGEYTLFNRRLSSVKDLAPFDWCDVAIN